MIKKVLKYLLLMLLMVGFVPAMAAFRDVKADLNSLLDNSEKVQGTEVSFGIAVAEDGSVSRVATDDATAVATVSGKYHSDHGWNNVQMVIAVEGPVKVGFGNCTYSSNASVITPAEGEAVSVKMKAECYKNNNASISYGYYAGGATTLTLKGSNYCPYVSVEAISLEDIPNDIEVSFAIGGEAAGVVPSAMKVAIGDKFVIPANTSLYVEGKTLVGWTDGTNEYSVGKEYEAGEVDLALTPVFAANTVTLADRTEPVTIKWVFGEKNGCMGVGFEGGSGVGFVVAQAKVGEATIDVKLAIDATSGKFNNKRADTWAQVNIGTKLTLPSCKGAVVTINAYGALGAEGKTATTIDGQSDYTSGTAVSYTIIGTNETIDIVAGDDAGYMSDVQVVLPVQEKSYVGSVYDNAFGYVGWAIGNEVEPAVSEALEGAVSLATYSVGADLTVASATYFEKNMTKYTPVISNAGVVEGVKIEYGVKAAKGVTFSVDSVSYASVKVGTDGATYSYTFVTNGEETEAVLVDAATTLRNNGSNAATASLYHRLNPEATDVESFSFCIYVSNTANNKNLCFSDIKIYGKFSGTVQDIAKFTLDAKADKEESGSVSIYPAGGTYDDGTEIVLTATENFGYDFVNWTDANGDEVSTEAKFAYTLKANTALTANFKAVNTYELNLSVEGEANDYMIGIAPAPTMVGDKKMYEEGTEVTLSAMQNAILTFTNWSDGSTNGEKRVTMDGDIALTATYSALDYIVGWDFIVPGNNSRPADFVSTVDNEAVSLILRNEAGDIQGWLDKSKQAANGYESFEGAAVNWKNIADKYYYETKINATEFTNIVVKARMLYNYNAYTVQKIEYSVDGTTWKEAGRVTIPGAKVATDIEGKLGEDANNVENLYIRFIPDYESAIDGSEGNDGTAITDIYIYGDVKLVDDGKAPAIVSTIPANGALSSSAAGKIVINFDEKIKFTDKVSATVGDKQLKGIISGKTITFSYAGLDYGTEYTFTLAANSVSDLTDNVIAEVLTIKFTTMVRPTVAKGAYDADVKTIDELLAALGKADGNTRYRIFLHNGTYDLGSACLTNIPGNVSLIGESREGVVIVNKAPAEGIGISATLCTGGENIYMQDLTIKNAGDYDQTAFAGRFVALQENASKAMYKNVCLLSNQDTYYTRANKRTYWEGGMITGTVDYICGGGDVFFNGVTLYNNARNNGNCITAPATSSDWGYVFSDCIIDGDAGQDGIYSLGRPWQGSPRAVYINTTMKILPIAAGWTSMQVLPGLFAEYNSKTANGVDVDLSNRTTTFDVRISDDTSEKQTATYNPVLTAEEAAKYTIDNVLGGDDNWQPYLFTEQAPAPTNVKLDGTTLSWDDNQYALLWAIVKNGSVVAFTTEPTYTVDDATATWSVRAANEMGGLGDAVKVGDEDNSPISNIDGTYEVVKTEYYTLQGVRVNDDYQGVVIKVDYLSNGEKVTTKTIK